MNQKTKMEQKALDALNSLIEELVAQKGAMDLKNNVIPDFYYNVLFAAYKAGVKNPVQWTTDTLNLGRNYFYQLRKKEKNRQKNRQRLENLSKKNIAQEYPVKFSK